MTREEYDDYRNRYNPVEEALQFAQKYYKEQRKRFNLPWEFGKCWQGEIDEMDENSVTTFWEDSWGYSGNEHGYCEVPLEALIGSKEERMSFIDSFVKKEIAKLNQAKSEKEARKKESKRKQYEALKREFEGNVS